MSYYFLYFYSKAKFSLTRAAIYISIIIVYFCLSANIARTLIKSYTAKTSFSYITVDVSLSKSIKSLN